MSARASVYREQTVEIALGPKGAFENGNIGALRLRAPPSQVVSPTPPEKPAKSTQDPPSSRAPPKSHRVESPPGIRSDSHSGRYRLPGGHHPRSGDTGHGPTAPCPGDPGKDPLLSRHLPTSPSDRADASAHWSNQGTTRSVPGVQQVLGLGVSPAASRRSGDSNPHGFPHHPRKESQRISPPALSCERLPSGPCPPPPCRPPSFPSGQR